MTSRPIYGSGMLDLRPETSDAAVKDFQSDFKSKMGAAGKVAGTALVAGVSAVVAAGAASIMAAIGQEATGDKAAARLGLSEADAARLGKAAGDAYKNNFGESIAEVQGVAADVWRRFGDVGDESLQKVTEGALTLADVFDTDVNEILQAAQEQFANGLAPTAEEALDIVAAALQGAKGPTDEVLAALNEYSDHFAQIGLDAPNVIGALTSEWSTNMYAIDKVGDAVKEFGIRVLDGSTLTQEGLAGIGFELEEVEAAFAQGGPAAEQMTTDIIKAITSIEDPAKRAQIGVALMGTPFEDLGKDAVPILNDLVAGVDDFGGSTQKVADQAYDNIQGRLAGAWRTVSQTVVEKVGGMILPHIDKISKWATEELPVLIEGFAEWLPGAISTAASFVTGTLVPAFKSVVAWVSKIVEWWQNLSPESKKLVGDLALAAGAAIAAGAAAMKLVQGFKAVQIALAALKLALAANPYTLLIGATVALVVLIVKNWDKIKAAFGKAWDWIKDKAKAVADWVSARWEGIIDFFKKLPGRITGAVGDLFRGVRDAFKNAVNWIIDKWNNFRLEIKLPGILGGGTIGIDTPNLPRLHDGVDRVPGGRHDEMLAILQGGERVMSRAEVAVAGETDGRTLPNMNIYTVNAGSALAREVGREIGWQLRAPGI